MKAMFYVMPILSVCIHLFIYFYLMQLHSVVAYVQKFLNVCLFSGDRWHRESFHL